MARRTFGNAVFGGTARGMGWGAAVGGGLGIAAMVMTGGLALPFALGGIAAGAALFGAVSGAVGVGIWAGGLLKSALGLRGPEQGQHDEYGMAPQQQQAKGLGLAESVVGLVGTVMGLKMMKDKLGDFGLFGGNDKAAQSASPVSEDRLGTQFLTGVLGKETYAQTSGRNMDIQDFLASKVVDGKVQLTQDEVALYGPMIANYGREVAKDAVSMQGSKDLSTRLNGASILNAGQAAEDKGSLDLKADGSYMVSFDVAALTSDKLIGKQGVLEQNARHFATTAGLVHGTTPVHNVAASQAVNQQEAQSAADRVLQNDPSYRFNSGETKPNHSTQKAEPIMGSMNTDNTGKDAMTPAAKAQAVSSAETALAAGVTHKADNKENALLRPPMQRDWDASKATGKSGNAIGS